MTAAMPLKACAVQFEPTLFRKDENVATLLGLVEQAARDGAKLITTPEMATTGYCWQNREEVAPFVEPSDGPTVQRFIHIAKQYDCYIVIGMPEVDVETGLYYNSGVLVGPAGVIGTHRKSHPYISEPKWAANGDHHQVFETPIGNIAILICMDIHFIETARLMAVQGAQVICHISNWLAERTPAPYWLNRAWENHCALIESNRWGWERGVQFSGGSCLVDPDGSVVAMRDSGDGLVAGTLNLADPQDNPMLAWRRPELYHELATNTYSWNPNDFFGLYGFDALPQGKTSTIATGQFLPQSDWHANLAQIQTQSEQAKARGAELVLFPEAALTGLAAADAMSLDDPAVVALQALAVELNLHIATGWREREGSHYYNSLLLVGPEGIVANYRQLHVGPEAGWRAGEQWVTCDLPCGRIGLLLGDELNVPEAGRILALKGCDLILCAAALAEPAMLAHPGTSIPHPYPIPTGADSCHWLLPRVRAGENNVWLAFANQVDNNDGYGMSGIYGPDTFAFPRQESRLLTQSGMTCGVIDTGRSEGYPDHVVRRKDLVLMRQPQDYLPLIQSNNR